MEAVLTTVLMPMPPRLRTDEETGRVQIVAPESWIERIEAFRSLQRAGVRMPSASAVIRQLVDEALDHRGFPKAAKAKPD